MQAKHWLWVEEDKSRFIVQLGLMEPKSRKIITFEGPRHKPQWLQVLRRLCQGKWCRERELTRYTRQRITLLLDYINDEYHTKFELKSRFLRGKRGREIGLVGG